MLPLYLQHFGKTTVRQKVVLEMRQGIGSVLEDKAWVYWGEQVRRMSFRLSSPLPASNTATGYYSLQ